MVSTSTAMGLLVIIVMLVVGEAVVNPCSKVKVKTKGCKKGKKGCGGKGSCFEATTIVWSKNETQSDDHARQATVKNLREGDLVGTIDLNMDLNELPKFTWTRATDVTISTGKWNAHTFTFASGHQLTVTSPHLMIVWKDGMSYFERADEIQIGDEMNIGDTTTLVKRVRNHMIDTKVAVETEDGTIQVNGILASGFCDDNPNVINNVVKTKPIIENYKSCHFGEDYNTMCMDSVAWKNAYMINNRPSI
jgi:hypothetical protein